MASILERAKALDKEIGTRIQEKRWKAQKPGEAVVPLTTLTENIAHFLRRRPFSISVDGLFFEGERVNLKEVDERIAEKLGVPSSPLRAFLGTNSELLNEVGLGLRWSESDEACFRARDWDGRYTIFPFPLEPVPAD